MAGFYSRFLPDQTRHRGKILHQSDKRRKNRGIKKRGVNHVCSPLLAFSQSCGHIKQLSQNMYQLFSFGEFGKANS